MSDPSPAKTRTRGYYRATAAVAPFDTLDGELVSASRMLRREDAAAREAERRSVTLPVLKLMTMGEP